MDGSGGCVDILVETLNYNVSKAKLTKMLQSFAYQFNLSHYDVSLRFVDNATISELNSTFRKKKYATDVLSFPQQTFRPKPKATLNPPKISQYTPNIQSQALGDIVISLEYVEKSAERIGQGMDRETAFLLAHGFAHLCGYDHITPYQEAKMKRQQNILMKTLETPKAPLWKNCISKRKT